MRKEEIFTIGYPAKDAIGQHIDFTMNIQTNTQRTKRDLVLSV